MRQVEVFVCQEPRQWMWQRGHSDRTGQDRRVVMAQQRPPWEEVAVFSMKTMGLWSTFGALRLHESVMQRA